MSDSNTTETWDKIPAEQGYVCEYFCFHKDGRDRADRSCDQSGDIDERGNRCIARWRRRPMVRAAGPDFLCDFHYRKLYTVVELPAIEDFIAAFK